MKKRIYILMFLSVCTCYVPQSSQIRAGIEAPFSTSVVMKALFCQSTGYNHGTQAGDNNVRMNAEIQEAENWFSRGSSFWGYGFWFFQVLSHFLTILVLNSLFGKFFAKVNRLAGGNPLRTLGMGLLYLIGLPLIASYSLLALLGLPFAILLLLLFVLSLWLGDCLAALLACHFLNSRNERSWNFWTVVLLSLGVVVVLDLLLFFPILGILLYLAVLAYTFGTLANMVLQSASIRELRASLFT